MGDGQKENMQVTINVHVTGTIDANNHATADATYSGSSTPAAQSGKTVVGSNGDVDLTAIDRDKTKYKKDADIVFYLEGSVTDSQGNQHSVSYPIDPANPNSGNDAVTVTGKNPDKFEATLDDNWTLVLEDQDDDGDRYNYTLNAHIAPLEEGGSGWTVPLEPVIINRGVGD